MWRWDGSDTLADRIVRDLKPTICACAEWPREPRYTDADDDVGVVAEANAACVTCDCVRIELRRGHETHKYAQDGQSMGI